MSVDTHADSEERGVFGVSPLLRLVVLQPTPFCNIDCSYCYLPHRSSTARMSSGVLEMAWRSICSAPFLGTRLDVAWHAGEPLVLPVSWYEDAVVGMARHTPPDLVVTHCFQTNGLLLDDEWAVFLARLGARVGLSIDGPADIHDRHRRTRAGGGTHADAMRAVRVLQDHSVPFHVISVLTAASLDEPDRLFAFYEQNGIRDVGFNVEEIEGAHNASSLAGTEARFRRFLARFLSLVWSRPGVVRLREAESTLAALLSAAPIVDEQNQPFAIVTIGVDGTLSTFSPELLGTRHERFAGFAFGNVAQGSLDGLMDDSAFRRVASEIRQGVESCAGTCRYFRWCGGGAPANKLFETGRFDATETMHCRLIQQAMLDEVLTQIETHAGGLLVAQTESEGLISKEGSS